ncbi:Asp/Glu/hydantoin racemase [Natrinema pellirubrum DSM 15624]|uniref:Asp/Glu/hydantoin racemase n=1 Tax=Natrinema pellirubrum (strain DSM 15624 / CIP 106293 / JCM 10476 / NCIMB 786 / 157) TaxID=797303 RepID=L0JHZ3_NATP1|nr:aspartate/glutamate racemase family protein [Natrinema pellirubrum]AGB30187.1 maleate cis-trans isomerase [Natrinema pellirubrum DSM 15624]ELY78250.1 Asp/Glu/hydantoin racemase [Natrinema pellirubrum DSM 15624]
MTDADADRGGRLGLIVPSSNTTAEPEFRAFLPDGITVHGARMALESVTVDELDAMSDDAARAAELLGHADVDAVAYACTTGSLLHGPGFDIELEARLQEAAGVPAVATARSVVRALEALEAERIAVATPYTTELDDRERAFLEDAGVDVASIDGRGLAANTDIGALTPDDAARQVLEAVDGDDVDAVFVSCTNYRSLAVVDDLESRLGIPVITSNGATLWDACGAAGFKDAFDGPGTLFDHDREPL